MAGCGPPALQPTRIYDSFVMLGEPQGEPIWWIGTLVEDVSPA